MMTWQNRVQAQRNAVLVAELLPLRGELDSVFSVDRWLVRLGTRPLYHFASSSGRYRPLQRLAAGGNVGSPVPRLAEHARPLLALRHLPGAAVNHALKLSLMLDAWTGRRIHLVS